MQLECNCIAVAIQLECNCYATLFNNNNKYKKNIVFVIEYYSLYVHNSNFTRTHGDFLCNCNAIGMQLHKCGLPSAARLTERKFFPIFGGVGNFLPDRGPFLRNNLSYHLDCVLHGQAFLEYFQNDGVNRSDCFHRAPVFLWFVPQI